MQLIAAHIIDESLDSNVDAEYEESSKGRSFLSHRFSKIFDADCADALGGSVEAFAFRVIEKRAELRLRERQAFDAAVPDHSLDGSAASSVGSVAGLVRGGQDASPADWSVLSVLSLAQSVPEALAAELVRHFGVRGALAFAVASNQPGPVNLRRNAIVRATPTPLQELVALNPPPPLFQQTHKHKKTPTCAR
jgi:hypothetical protein